MSNEKEIKKINPLPNLSCINNFPYVDDSIDAVNQWQLLQKVWSKCSEVIDLSTLTQQQQVELYNYVMNYFTNLNVQDEIDNKLDEMTEDGSLGILIDKTFLPYKHEINSIIEEQNNRIGKILSGTPIAVSSIDEMTNINKIYVNTTDGYWYFYNGSAWEKGSIYQATAIADDSITSNKINGGFNILDGVSFDLNTFINPSGEIVSSSFTDLSDFIQVKTDDRQQIYDKLYFSVAPANRACIVIYNQNKEFVAFRGAGAETKYGYEYPLSGWTTGYYIRIPRFHDYPNLTVLTTKFKELKWLTNSNKLERPSNGEVHFTVDINRKINNVEDIYSDNAVLFLPTNYSKNGKKTRLIISCHGSGTIINNNFHISSKSWNEFFYNMGFAILDVNGGVDDGRNYGASFALSSYIKAYEYAIENYNLYSEIFVLGASMGGLNASNIVNNTKIPVLAQAGFCPVTDHYQTAWCYPWYSENGDYSVQRKAIARYFNFDNYDSFNQWTTNRVSSIAENEYYLSNIEKIYGFNPIIHNNINWKSLEMYTTSSGDTKNYNNEVIVRNVPLKMWQAIDDGTVLIKYNEFFKKFINNAGSFCEMKIYEGKQHSPGWGGQRTIKNIFGKNVTGFDNEIECYNFFKNFD